MQKKQMFNFFVICIHNGNFEWSLTKNGLGTLGVNLGGLLNLQDFTPYCTSCNGTYLTFVSHANLKVE